MTIVIAVNDMLEELPDSVMIIENKYSLRKELASSLDEAVCIVAEVSDYFEALTRINEFNPDIAIVGENLPFVSGWEVCQDLSQTYKIPVILIGDDRDEKVWLKAFEAGADYYLRTPFSSLELTARIKAILRRYKKIDYRKT